VYSGHDFGLVNPAALFYAGSPGTGDFFGFAEYVPGIKMGYHDHVLAFKAITEGRNVLKRVGGNHAEEGERQAYSAQGWPISEPKHSQDKALQIKMVQGMHRLNKVYIFNDLTNYVREKFSFVTKEDKIVDEAKFHCMSCFVAGTMVQTDKGETPIELIKVGDMVATRQGYQKVIEAGKTGIARDVMTATFSNGETLTGTPDHPIYVRGRGFVPLTCLRYNDIIEIWTEKQLSTMELNTTDTHRQNVELTEIILGQGRDFSTVLCGKMPMGRYLRDILSTIKTLTSRITNYLTSCVREMHYIGQTIIENEFMTLTTWLGLNPSALLDFDSGLQRMRAGQASETVYGERNNQLLKSVSIVEKNTQLLNHRTASSVLRTTKQPIDVRCLEIKTSNKATVYNLCVNAVPEYFANGILVHNCERYILSDFTPETVARHDTPLPPHRNYLRGN
jgi:hypothetical protein